ncbi:hypothetical protein PoB_007072800 [Plakobranchus ocellatus]|uniref:Uncharacterized protein n=1 Tax=Plakobranchus ocellatus TaxID=259542 RepID=A0AAV4DIX4_9GAST|nr:hypothetical protein PoB_007072800 [Plakobranchus ocellatus]
MPYHQPEDIIHGDTVATITTTWREQVRGIRPGIGTTLIVCTKARITCYRCPPSIPTDGFILQDLFKFCHQLFNGHFRIPASLQHNASISAVTVGHFSSRETTATSPEP